MSKDSEIDLRKTWSIHSCQAKYNCYGRITFTTYRWYLDFTWFKCERITCSFYTWAGSYLSDLVLILCVLSFLEVKKLPLKFI